MKLTVTSIELKGPFHFFALSLRALRIMRQLKSTEAIAIKTRGFWTTHYTMSLWKSEDDLKTFARSGAHLAAMKTSREIAKEIRTLTLDADHMPDWKTAIAMLDNAKVLKF